MTRIQLMELTLLGAMLIAYINVNRITKIQNAIFECKEFENVNNARVSEDPITGVNMVPLMLSKKGLGKKAKHSMDHNREKNKGRMQRAHEL